MVCITPVSGETEDAWQVNLVFDSFQESSDDTTPPPPPARYNLTFGVHPDATHGFDRDLDKIAPPPPMDDNALEVYFPCDHETVTRLVDNIRPVDNTEWELVAKAPEDSDVTVSWDIWSIPPHKKFILELNGEQVNMKSQGRLSLESGKHDITIKLGPFTEISIDLVQVPEITANSSSTTSTNLRDISRNFAEDTGIEKYEYTIRSGSNNTRSTNVSVNISDAPPRGTPPITGTHAPPFYYTMGIDQDDDWYNDVEEVHLRIYYNKSTIQNMGIDESSLRPLRYTDNEWILLDIAPRTLSDGTVLYSSGVDADVPEPYVWANLSRFSTYGIGGDLQSTEDHTSALSGSGSGSGGGGGGSAGEHYENIDVVEVVSRSISSGVPAEYSFTEHDMSLTSITFKPLQNLGSLEVRAETLHERSEFANTDPEGLVYKHFNVWFDRAGFTEDQHYENAKIEFKVDNLWLQENDIDVDTIRLKRYTEGYWQNLDTTIQDSDDIWHYFVADTPAFLQFAIIGYQTNEKSEKSSEILDPEPEDIEDIEEEIPGFSILLGISILLTLTLFIKRK
ncbi:PGF-pre-PGF domain-containing protein [Methanosalsum zhilinae]|nr:PGF-pre-PGF domain-containing protein [Methanosalsum zhilinae]